MKTKWWWPSTRPRASLPGCRSVKGKGPVGPWWAHPMERKQKAPRGTAKDRALRLLGVRWRSRVELQQRLRLAGFPPEEIDQAIQDLDRAGLVDDARFARAVVADRAGRRLAGDREIRMVLRRGGISEDTASAAMAGAGDESGRALELARNRAARLSGLQ